MKLTLARAHSTAQQVPFQFERHHFEWKFIQREEKQKKRAE